MYFLGIDNGGTMSKAVLFDRAGKEVGSASEQMALITPQPGFTERDMELLWQMNVRVINAAVSAADIDPKVIKGIACTGHGKGLYLWGKDGKPAYNGIVSTDSRAWEYPARWAEDGTADKAFEMSCQSILACQPVSLLNWFKDHKPEVLENTQWIFAVKDYIRFRLTGEAFAEVTDYSGSNLMNLETKGFDPELLALFGLEGIADALPPVKGSTESCGGVTAEVAAATGLAEGTAVAGGMFDIDACAIAMDIVDDENICVIAGTWSINQYISRKPVLDRSIMMNSRYCLDEYYLIEECSPTSAGNLDWFVDTFLAEEKKQAAEKGENIFKQCDELVGAMAPQDQDIIFLPFLFGSNYNPRAKACLLGMGSHHSSVHALRAIYEGIVFCHMVHIGKLLQSREQTRAIRLGGGAAKSAVWAQMFADASGLPVETIETDELGTLGCAMAAAVAADEFADLKEAANEMVKVKARLEPDMARHEIYKGKFAAYRKAESAVSALWNNE